MRYFVLFAILISGVLAGCGSKDVPAKKEFSDQDKKQIEELNKQRVDEWGNKVK